jgi:hypothetical protein
VLVVMLALGGCGGGGDEEASTGGGDEVQTPNVGRMEIEGASAADRRMAMDLGRYLHRNCGEGGAPTFAQFRRRALAPHGEIPPQLVRRFIERRYGSLRNAFLVQTRSCQPASISVSNGVITVDTDLEDDRLGRLTAKDACNLIQGSDVADFTVGHRVLAADGTVLARCPARTN